MISVALAQQLKQDGLQWIPAKNDFFAIPDRGLDDVIFVLSDMTVILARIHGQPAVTFHGSVEWALDHILIAEVVWLPTESQLRRELERRLAGAAQPLLSLTSTRDGYRCQIQFDGQMLAFESFGAAETYGLALHHVLTSR